MSYDGEGIVYAIQEAAHQLARELAPDGPELRDRFAMAALEGMIASHRGAYAYADIAFTAYMFADAMLLARKGKQAEEGLALRTLRRLAQNEKSDQ